MSITDIAIELRDGDRLRKVLGFAFFCPTTGNDRKGNNELSVMRLGYVHTRVTDLPEAVNHYSNTLGMAVVHEEPARCT